MDIPETVAQLRRQLTAFSQFTTRSLGKADLDALMLDACLRARAGIRVSHAKLLEYLPDRDHLLMRAGAGWKEGYVGHYAVPLRFDSAISQAFTSSQPVAVEDYSARDDIEFPEILKAHDCISSVNVPINTDDGAFGILEVDHIEPRRYSADDVYFLTGLGNTVAQAVQLKRSLLALKRLLDERQLFASEMNHRVKNNLSLVSSMLSLQRRRDPTVQGPLNDAIQRINNLALVHDRLQFFSQMDTAIDATSHFQDLGRILRSLLPPGVTLTIDCSGLVLSNCIESLTLIANELVTNAAKYAFEGRDLGQIVLGYRQEGPGWRLWVKDDGLGLSGKVDAKASFGTELIAALVDRLNAQIRRTSNEGTCVEVFFGVSNQTAPSRADAPSNY